MRGHLKGDHRAGGFSRVLLDIGESKLNDKNNVAGLYTLLDNVDSLINHIYLDTQHIDQKS